MNNTNLTTNYGAATAAAGDDSSSPPTTLFEKFPDQASAHAAEKKTLNQYLMMTGSLSVVVAPLVAYGLLWLLRRVSNVVEAQHEERIRMLTEYDLGWVYLSWFVLSLARTYCVLNANGTRAATTLDRPDQHAYQTNSSSAGAVSVMMVNTGSAGRFNRAQRAAFQMDEGLELLVTGILLAGFVVPSFVFGLVLIYGCGRIVYAIGYTNSAQGRMYGMAVAMVPQLILSALVLVFAIESFVV